MTHCSPGTPDAKARIHDHVDLLAFLPDPPETFHASLLPAKSHGDLRKLCRHGLIEKVGRATYEFSNSRNDRWEYQIARWAVEEIERVVENRDVICPCGHGGMSNRGDYYECGFGLCDREFERDELEVDA